MTTGELRNQNSENSISCEIIFQDGCLLVYPKGGSMESWSLPKIEITEHFVAYLKIRHSGTLLIVTGAGADSLYKEIRASEPVEKKSGNFPAATLLVIGVAGLAITALVVIAIYASLPFLAEKAADMVPVEYEVSLGERLSEGFGSEALPAGDSVNYYATRFSAAMKLDSRYPISVRVIPSEEINAFAVPGGKIFIYSGLLEKMESYEELAALLGHEVTHVVKRHSLRSLMSNAAAGVLLSTIFGSADGLGSWVVSQAGELKQLDYSRELETEADTYGLSLLVANHINPKGMLKLLQLLEKEHEEEPGMMKYLSTHPDTQSRIQNIENNPSINEDFDRNAELEGIFQKIKSSLAAEVLK